jgi:nucleotide-binding universal stress UspA family protein
MRKILAATDFSPCSNAALDLALEVAKRQGASLTLLHVCQMPSYEFMGGGVYVPSPELTDDIRQDALAALEKARQRLDGQGVAIECRVLTGTPGPDIVAFARQFGHELIVVGTHGRRGLRRLLLGSVAETVVRNADVPVLTARAPADGPAAAAIT